MQDDHAEACAIILTDRGRSCTTLPSTVGLIAEGEAWIVWFCNRVVHLYQYDATSVHYQHCDPTLTHFWNKIDNSFLKQICRVILYDPPSAV